MIESLSLSNGFWPILALDHGLTIGHGDSVSLGDLPQLLRGCKSNVGSVVMTYGLARRVREYNELPLIVQCFGAPLGHPKVQVCSVDRALDLEAKGVAVQIDFGLTGERLCNQLKSVARLVGQAHAASLPVLFMVAEQKKGDLSEFSRATRFCIELGADLIKIRCNPVSLDQESCIRLEAVVSNSPPVLLTGGTVNNRIADEVSAARVIGFSGYCIGRNIFKAENPVKMVQMLRDAWQNTPIK